MKLRDLDGRLVRRTATGWEPVQAVTEADGVFFLCPKCYAANGGAMGTHGVLCWFAGRVPDELEPRPGRWTPRGTSLDDLSLYGPEPGGGGARSVLLTSATCPPDGQGWHGHVNDGDAA